LGISLKKRLLLGVAFGALIAANPSAAAPPAPVVPTFNWTGFYVGVNAGYSWGNGAFVYNEPAFACCGFGIPTTFTGTQNLNGAVGGFQTGYNVQSGLWVVGVETDFDWTGEKGTSGFTAPYSFPFQTGFEGPTTTVHANIIGAVTAKIDWVGTLRGRAGWLVTPTTLFYGTAGLAYGGINVSGSVTDTACGGVPSTTCTWSFGSGRTQAGYVVGAGVEGLIPGLRSVIWRLEYLYIDLGTVRGSGVDALDFVGPFFWSQRVTDNILRAGISVKIP
jgi:outer membrane immunogenic protein